MKYIILLCLMLVIIILTASGGLRAFGYYCLQKSIENERFNVAEVLVKIGVQASPDDKIINWYQLASVTDTPLQLAAKAGNEELVETLIDSGVVIDWCCCSCVTPLHYAIINGNEKVVKMLLEAGADPEKIYDLTLTPGELALKYKRDKIASLIKEHIK